MLDLHSHILPGVDDGPSTLDESLALAEFCARDGITHIVATPHCHRRIRTLRMDILPRVAMFNAELAKAKIALAVLPGSEIQAYDTALYRREFDAGIYCHLGDSDAFTLLEFSWDGRKYPEDAPELVAWLRERGTTAIVAHPERYKLFRDEPAKLQALVDEGAWLQLTVDSLLGNHGSMAEDLAAEQMAKFKDVLLATDTHNLQRCSGLSAGYKWVRQRFGVEREANLRTRAEGVLARLLSILDYEAIGLSNRSAEI
jgi:protein-tyrosine phosphatase